jgi:hypothetical protein
LIKPNRKLRINTYNIRDVFEGLEEQEILYEVYDKEELKNVLDELKVKIVDDEHYMRVDDTDGSIIISYNHLLYADDITLHLDIIHELVHIKQLLEGKELYDDNYSYVDRDTEVEAYRITVKEAKRLGLRREEILDYLKVEWITEKDLIKLAKKLGIL